MIQNINLENTKNIIFNNRYVKVLKLNSDIIWKEKPEPFNYTGLDVNGNMEGQLAFDGTIVAYAIGKPTITYSDVYTKLSTIPTTRDEYIGYYYNTGASTPTYVLITNENIDELISAGTIVVGTTEIYYISGQEDYIKYGINNAFNSEYYDGYDFTQPVETLDYLKDVVFDNRYFLDSTLIIPDTYKGLPVVKVLPSAIYTTGKGTDNNGATYHNIYQSYKINDIVLGQNIKDIGFNAFGTSYSRFNVNNKELTISSPVLSKMGGTIPSGLASYGAFGEIINMTRLKVITNQPLKLIGRLAKTSYYYTTGNNYRLGKCFIDATSLTLSDSSGSSLEMFSDITFSKNITSIAGELSFTSTGITQGTRETTNLVFNHTNNDTIDLSKITKPKNAVQVNIYTNNTYIQNFDWSSKNITPTFYSLSKYTG